jgi:prevent-host-death family protein
MQTIKASEFKAKCLALMDEVALTGETIRVTKHGKPIVELRPIKPDSPLREMT